MKTIKKLFLIWKWIYVQILGRVFYDKKYMGGRWFADGINSQGYIWAYEDIRYRLCTLKHLYIPWPVSPQIELGDNIEFDPDDLNNMNGRGNYFQTIDGKIVIGKGTYIANNVGIITTNHAVHNPDEHVAGRDVFLGKACWIGMNSVILPGVVLGDHTIVGAGAVVTKSFEDGNCVIAGNPAKKIKDLT